MTAADPNATTGAEQWAETVSGLVQHPAFPYVLVLALLLAWIAHSIARPYTVCVACKGNSRKRGFSGKSWRNCAVCKGSGKRRRLIPALLARRGDR